VIALLLSSAIASVRTASAECELVTTGVDSSLANNSGGTLINSVGQTFLAEDTVVTSLTVWRIGGYYAVTPLITRTDESGTPVGPPLWQGPSTNLPDPPAVPTPLTWMFDPPLVLPGRGTYAWFVCSVDFDMLGVSGGDAYANGQIWDSSRGECGPGSVRPIPDADFVFMVTFCRDSPTPARRATWGDLKLRYR
jgi:hypothetical protein